MQVSVLVFALVVALASATCALVSPSLSSTFAVTGDTSGFQRLRIMAQDNGAAPLVLMTENNLVSAPHGHIMPIPAKYRASAALLIYWAGPSSDQDPFFILRVAPTSNPQTLYALACGAPASGNCSFSELGSVHMPDVPADTVWRDIAVVDNVPGNEDSDTFIALCSDTFLMGVLCSSLDCTVVGSIRPYADMTREDISAYPVLLAANTFDLEDSDALIWLSLSPSLNASAPGALLRYDAAANHSHAVTTFFAPNPINVLTFSSYGEKSSQYVFVSLENANGTTSFFEFDLGAGDDMVGFAFAMNSGDALVPNLFVTPDLTASSNYPTFVITAHAGGLSAYSYLIENIYGSEWASETSKAAVVSGLTPSAAVASQDSNAYLLAVGAHSAAGVATVVSFSTPQFANDIESTSEAPRRESVGRERHRAAASLASGPSASCVDHLQPPTCLMSCSPLPSVICGPSVPAPTGYTCFILPTHPDACNNCPVQFVGTCSQ